MTNRWVRFIIRSLLLVVLLVVFSSALRSTPNFVIPVVLILSIGIGLCAFVWSRAALIFLGAGLCVLPMLGSGALNVFVTAWLLGYELRRVIRGAAGKNALRVDERLLCSGFVVLIASFVLGAGHTLVFERDQLLLSTIFEAAGFSGLASHLWDHLVRWSSVLLLIAGYLICGFLAFSLIEARQEGHEFRPVILGLAMGVMVSSVVLVLQCMEIHPVFLLNRTAFWDFAGRYSASFSDPNAFGLMAALLVPLLFSLGQGRGKWLLRGAASVFLIAACWSGSRTTWVGVVLWSVLWFWWTACRQRGKNLRRYIVLGGALLLVGIAIMGYPPLNAWLQQFSPAPAVTRVLKTCHWREGREMVASRLIYSRIALTMWRGDPIIGVGLGRFYGQQERAARAAGIELGGWRDNANNFYLQILAEQGILGLLLVLCSFFLFGLACRSEVAGEEEQEKESYACPGLRLYHVGQTSLVVMVLLLFIGPHFFFDEVRYLVTVILAFTVASVPGGQNREAKLSLRRKITAVTIIAVLLYVIMIACAPRQKVHTKGFYHREYSEDIGFFAWTGRKARLVLCPASKAPLALALRAANPDLASRPLSVTISRVHPRTEKVMNTRTQLISDYRWQKLELASTEIVEGGREVLELEVDRVWSPSEGNPEGDKRWLGVMLRWPEEACVE